MMQDLSAEGLLHKVASRYAGARTYQDKGSVYTTFHGPSRTYSNEVPFATAFRRAGDQFRFDFVVPYPGGRPPDFPERRWIIFRNGAQIAQCSFLREKATTPKSFDLLIAGATGVSGGAAHHIPALLMAEEISGRKLTDRAEAARVLDEVDCGTHKCLRLEAHFRPAKDDFVPRIWIDPQRLLIRRLDERARQGDLIVNRTTTYDPIMDESVPNEALEFVSPDQEDR
jgi:hypothetical protein